MEAIRLLDILFVKDDVRTYLVIAACNANIGCVLMNVTL